MTHNENTVCVTMLGTGTSTGVPVIGCSCRVCSSADPRDKRSRTACWIRVGEISIVIDTGPDFRRQALREGIDRVDAVLYTHHHFDHVVGIDDLRPFLFSNRRPIPCFAHEQTAVVLRSMFRYIFADGSYPGVPSLDLRIVDRAFDVHDRYQHGGSTIQVIPIEAFHGALPLFGYRVGNFAYLTDTSHIPDASLGLLEGVDTLVLDALRHEAHPTHFTIAEAVDVARRVGARKTYFTHMTHSFLHAEETDRLPEGIELAYDGLTFEVR
jgi:phosphoribosyl 1,2-cyclic phosphate phosphodiesterase